MDADAGAEEGEEDGGGAAILCEVNREYISQVAVADGLKDDRMDHRKSKERQIFPGRRVAFL